MDETEKRGRGVFSRRQQQHQQHHLVPTPVVVPDSPRIQRKARRSMTDFMRGVAAALNARKGGQTPASIPTHIDISYRDRTDATAKRRFRVKVPFRLMTILGLVFLFIPILLFLHKEMHIHEGVAHYKMENYANVNTKDVWDNFKQATTTDDLVQEEGKVNGTISDALPKPQTDDSIDRVPALQEERQHNNTHTKPDARENESKHISTAAKEETGSDAMEETGSDAIKERSADSEEEKSGDTIDHSNLANGEDPPQESNPAFLEQENQSDLSPEKAAPLDDTSLVEENGNDDHKNNIEMNDGDTKIIGTTNSTASEKISDR